MNESPIKVAIVGFGFMGKTHYSRYRQLGGVEVAAIVDPASAGFASGRLESTGNIDTLDGETVDLDTIETYDALEELLSEGGVDVIDVCLPSYLHERYVVESLEAGYHVFCEKPIALDNESAARILAVAAKTDRCFSVGHSVRFSPAYAQTKEILDRKIYGRLEYAEFGRYSAKPRWAWNDWILENKGSGGAAVDIHIHDADMILYLFGVPNGLKSSGLSGSDGSFSQISTVYSYDDRLVTSTGGWICSSSFGFRSTALLVFEDATIELDSSKKQRAMVFPEEGEAFPMELPDHDGYYYELEDFLAYVATGNSSGIVTPESSAMSLKLCLEEIRSATEDKQVVIRGHNNWDR